MTGPPGHVDWVQVYRILLHGEGRKFSFSEIEHMTAAEATLALDRDLEKKRPSSGSTVLGQSGGMDLQEYADWWRSQSPRQRLERVRERWW